MQRGSITQVINGQSQGQHADSAMDGVYAELRACVRGVLARECGSCAGPHGKQDLTMVVHECWLKLQRTPHWDNRAHFFGAASRATRQVLIDMARSRQRRPPDRSYNDNLETGLSDSATTRNITDTAREVDAALNALGKHAPRAARIGGYRLFGDLSTEIIAEIEGVTPRTVQRDWNFARAWLASRLDGTGDSASSMTKLSDFDAEHA